MSRTQRLLDLLQILRRHRYPVTGAALAAQLGISLRTLYRDIAALQQQGANIAGEAGMGYVLRPGYMLPPLMFSEEEIDALALGLRWVARQGDARLAAAARDTLAKIGAVLPPELREALDGSALLAVPGTPLAKGDLELPLIRQAIRAERKLAIDYLDLQGAQSARTVWPVALGFFDRVRVLVAWCELRQGFRHFRADRIASLEVSEQRYPRRRQALFKEWRSMQSVPELNAAADRN
jgi:predicted DNA-binding transcriptional regulator YafY